MVLTLVCFADILNSYSTLKKMETKIHREAIWLQFILKIELMLF